MEMAPHVNNDLTPPNPQSLIYVGDANVMLHQLPVRKFNLIITSPPYNIGKEYEERKPLQDYLRDQEDVISQLADMLSETGSLCWQVGNMIDEATKEVFPLDIFYYQMFKDQGLILRNRIIWRFGHGLHASSRFSGRYEVILWFSKSGDYVFNLDDVRIPSKYPGKRHYKGPNKGNLSGNPRGKNPSDIWTILLQEWEEEVWDVPNVKANHVEKTDHPCQYPIELIERCILALTNENDWILDPFAGVGSTLLAAFKNNRNAIGIEMHQKYVNTALERLDALRSGTLKHRPLGKPIYDHRKSKLSEVPEEFANHESS